MKNFYSLFPLLLFLLLSIQQISIAQEVDIVPYLKQIERGEVEAVKNALPKLKKDNPNSSNILFLEGVLTENGQEALSIYQNIVDKYPNSSYADASLFRIYSYYYALGLYDAANKTYLRLQQEYPDSPYIKMIETQIIEDKESEKGVETIVEVEKDKTINQENKFTIQAGAFSNIENAEGLKGEFVSDGIFSEIREKTVGGTVFHVVYVGKFPTRDSADDFLRIVNSKYNLSGRVVDIPE